MKYTTTYHNAIDEYQDQLHRPFETLKRFFKIYLHDFPGASELRETLMHTKSTDEVRKILDSWKVQDLS
jgi:tRNA-dihydrouridine synthase